MVAVPIGCLEDMSLRALRILREVRLIICENKTVFRPTAEQFGITASLISCKTLQTDRPDADWVTRLLGGENVAFVCDAGTPTLADPGLRLVCAALRHDIPVSALPGPAAVLVALAASGLPANRFVFDGFPPRDPDARVHFFQSLAQQRRTTVLYESASALRDTLQAIRETCGLQRRVAVACRLTRPDETWVRGLAPQVAAHFRRVCPRGEYTIVIEGQRQKTLEIVEQLTRRSRALRLTDRF